MLTPSTTKLPFGSLFNPVLYRNVNVRYSVGFVISLFAVRANSLFCRSFFFGMLGGNPKKNP